jgi:hypothetical protein
MQSENRNEDVPLAPFTEGSRPASLAASEKTLAEGPPQFQRKTILGRSYAALLLFTFYASLSIYSWVTICILTFRPFGARSYNDFRLQDKHKWFHVGEIRPIHVRSQRLLKSAQIIGSIVEVLTLPIASSICARAAVVYSQKQRGGFSVRKATALADRDWIRPGAWLRGRKYWSRFLGIAVGICFLGMRESPCLLTRGCRS